MKLETTIISVAALASLTNALVIPQINDANRKELAHSGSPGQYSRHSDVPEKRTHHKAQQRSHKQRKHTKSKCHDNGSGSESDSDDDDDNYRRRRHLGRSSPSYKDKDSLGANGLHGGNAKLAHLYANDRHIEDKDSLGANGLHGGNAKLAPLYANDRHIKDKYIIVFKKNVNPEEIGAHLNLIAKEHTSSNDNVHIDSITDGILDTFSVDGLLNGYFGHFNEKLVDLIRSLPIVDFVENDSIVSTDEQNTQNNAPWGLARISHRNHLNLGSFNKYLYDDDAGKGVTAYVIDTGINVNHVEFDGRATWGKTVPQNDQDVDGNGHGTHCAGTIASKDYGVAKNANVVAVKVLKTDGSGTMSDVLKGVEYVAFHHQKDVRENKKGFKGSTANMSLGGGKSQSLDLAVNAAVRAGVHFAVAAGNENQDACNSSPAAAEKAITVGASTLSDDRAYFSNWGNCVDIFAPGLNILSTYIGSNDATATLSGTSMASPHVAGLLTYFLSLQPDEDSEFFTGSKGITPEQLKKKLIDYSTKDVFHNLPENTPNRLIFNGGHNSTEFWSVEPVKEHTRTGSIIPKFDFNNIIGSNADPFLADVQEVFHKFDFF